MNKKQNYQIISERIDDIVLLLSVMKQMKLAELIDDYLPRHWNQQGIDWGWVATRWLSYIGTFCIQINYNNLKALYKGRAND